MVPVQDLFVTLSETVKLELEQAGLPLSKSLDVNVLTHGLSNQNYLFRELLTGKAWVLRVNSAASSHICDRGAEVTNWLIAAKKGLAPSLYYVSQDMKYYLSEYIEQDTGLWGCLNTAKSAYPLLEESVLWPDADLALLSLLTQLSELPCPENSLSVSKQWAIYQESMQDMASVMEFSSITEHWHECHHALISLQDIIRQWLSKLDKCATAEQYSHRDLNPHNLLLREGKLYCIDFEYACSSHPLFDLAGVLSSHALSSSQRHHLIDAYLTNHPKLTSTARDSLPDAINIYWVFAACWSLLMAADEVGNSGVMVEQARTSPHQASQYLECFKQFYALIQKQE